MSKTISKTILLTWLAMTLGNPIASANDYFRITVVDAETDRGIPLVELTTVNNIRFVTDSAGVVAFHEPGLMNQRVYFKVFSHGYESPQAGFGFQGKSFEITPGGKAVLKLKRLNIAERLYRVTGEGIYRDSLLLGDNVPLAEPALNAGVLGSDSVVNTVFNNRIYWFWGDTNLPAHPLGIFDVPGATSKLANDGGLSPDVGVNLNYFKAPNGLAKATADMPGKGPTWIGGLIALKDKNLREKLLASYAKIEPPLETYERGIIEFDVAAEEFRQVKTFPLSTPLYPNGHPLKVTENGLEYVYFCLPFPTVRVPATAEAYKDLSQYETYTCLKAGSTPNKPLIDHDEQGAVRYSWKKGLPSLDMKSQAALVNSGLLKPNDLRFRLFDLNTGRAVNCHGGSVYWNEHRQRWVCIMLELFGTSPLGEIWYAEADTPLGPWQYAQKIVTHNNYSFYNPKQHPMFDQEDGRIIYFEGTYTHSFTNNKDQTLRYDYNQVMYRLDLDDERLALPLPIYRTIDAENKESLALRTSVKQAPHHKDPENKDLAFFAQDRKTSLNIPIYTTLTNGSQHLSATPNEGKPLFYAMQANQPEPPATTLPLFEFKNPTSGERHYTTTSTAPKGFINQGILCRVWTTNPKQP
ncbi:hypothetical protein [Thalassoglobus sp.]|uniref:hypothetical protein n=1 Tax=Thalassoglobus sp. TaxID=2795869 RepID=UPI003AA868C0